MYPHRNSLCLCGWGKNEDRIYLPVYNPILIFRTLHKFYLIFKIL
ncbi:hypothetical protein HMPREF0742_02682 [Rothia aeria F0184]|uniref:Uncharacterized protein n=1 Tax=Rothia aeria F0184 TaxID=888019 RepID=U7UWB3_9MICC|nr:hypothetical protein HMPREF0742_02682 [Rothia aeria F0184]